MKPIAIIGMACRVPGAADYRAFWDNVATGRVSTVEVTEEDLRAEGVRVEPAAGARYVPVAAPLDGYDAFDRHPFRLNEAEAAALDPQDRVFWETVWSALEDAACDPAREPGRIALFGGRGRGLLERDGASRQPARAGGVVEAALRGDPDFFCTRLSYLLDLRGPSLTVQTACSSSMVAVHLACQSIAAGEADVAVAGGASIEIPQRAGYYHQAGSIWSPDGVCRPFDADAAGTLVASGAGAVVLKALDAALADGDPVHAVLLGSAMNNDGARKLGFTAPSVRQQADVVRAALMAAGVDPESVGFVEAHGTGTKLGDQVEWAALNAALGASGEPCAVGSVKANVGHLGAAAGVVGLIKAALALERRRIPPMAGFTRLHPDLAREPSRLHVPREALAWDAGTGRRRAGISALGIGGTNVHAVLEEPPPAPPAAPALTAYVVLPQSAATEPSLAAAAELVGRAAEAAPDALPALAATLQSGRTRLRHRRATVYATGREEVLRLGEAQGVAATNPRPVFILPGQAAQVLPLARLAAGDAILGEAYEGALAALDGDLREEVRAAFGDPPAEVTAGARQVAVLVQGFALCAFLQAHGVVPAAVCGYSIGEVTAAAVAGAIDLADAAAVLAARALILAPAAGAGGMLVAHLGEAEGAALDVPGLGVAIVAGPDWCVFSGTPEAVETARATLRGRRIGHRVLDVEHAYHSPLLGEYVDAYRKAWAEVPIRDSGVALVSSTNGRPLSAVELADPAYWAGQLVAPVAFHQALRAIDGLGNPVALVLDTDLGIDRYVRAALSGPVVSIATPRQGHGFHPGSLGGLLAGAWSGGVEVDWTAGRPPAPRIHAPTYVFDRARFPVRGQPAEETAAPTAGNGHRGLDLADALSRSRAVLGRLLGVTAEATDPDTPFLEYGLDSFNLLQLAAGLSEELGATIEVTDLFGRLDTCRAVARWLESSTLSAAGTAATATAPRPESPGSVPVPRNAAPPEPAAAVPEADFPATPAEGAAAAIVAEFAARTPASKALVDRDRPHLADQRNVAGFRGRWKESSYPLVGRRGRGGLVWDADGHEYVDLCMGFGVQLFGHAPGFLAEALAELDPEEVILGPQSALAGEVTRGLCELTGMERAALCNSGTEAVMLALRLARAMTGRDQVVLFAGSYHGTFDGVLAAPGAGSRGVPLAPGIPAAMTGDVLVLPYEESSAELVAEVAPALGAVLVEPVQSRRPDHQPFDLLRRLREITREHGVPLIFDEIVTGFRSHPAGVQGLSGVRADLCTYGKVIGGGLPIGVVAGSAEHMSAVDGGVWRFGDASRPSTARTVFAGTFCKHPLAMAVARRALDLLRRESPELQERLSRRTAELTEAIDAAARARGFPLHVQRFASLFIFDLAAPPEVADLFFLGLLNRGVYVWEGRTCFLSTAHTDADSERVLRAVEGSMDDLLAGGLLRPVVAAAASPPAAPVPLTQGQELLWLGAEMGGDTAQAYVQSVAIDVDGPLDLATLETAVAVLAERHQGLRVRFDEDGQGQAIVPGMRPSLAETESADQAGLARRITAQTLVDFDLSAPPLGRFALHHLGDASVLQFTAPHAVFDDWSAGILWAELAEAYSALLAGRQPVLPPPADYAGWCRARRAREDAELAGNAAWWEDRLTGVAGWEPSGGRSGTSPASATLATMLPAEAALGLRRLAATARCTMHTAALTALGLTLMARSGAESQVVGGHLAGQPHDTDAPLIGFGVDMLPTVVRLPRRDQPLREVAQAVQRMTLEASARTAGLYRWLEGMAGGDRRTFAAVFNYGRPLAVGDFGGHRAREREVPRATLPWSLVLTVGDHAEDRVEARWEHRLAVHAAPDVEAMHRLFVSVCCLAADPAGTAGDLLALTVL